MIGARGKWEEEGQGGRKGKREGERVGWWVGGWVGDGRGGGGSEREGARERGSEGAMEGGEEGGTEGRRDGGTEGRREDVRNFGLSGGGILWDEAGMMWGRGGREAPARRRRRSRDQPTADRPGPPDRVIPLISAAGAWEAG